MREEVLRLAGRRSRVPSCATALVPGVSVQRSGAPQPALCAPFVVDFAERALDDHDIRLYQIHLTAKYEGLTNYEQPLHTDRNHSWLPASGSPPWWNLEGFLYLSDVTAAENPTWMVSTRDSRGVSPSTPVLMPDFAPDLYAAENRRWRTRLVSCLPLRRIPPGGRFRITSALSLCACTRFQECWTGLDRLRPGPITFDRTRMDRLRTKLLTS